MATFPKNIQKYINTYMSKILRENREQERGRVYKKIKQQKCKYFSRICGKIESVIVITVEKYIKTREMLNVKSDIANCGCVYVYDPNTRAF